MSKISDIQNNLNALIESTITGYVQLSDAYEPDDNAIIILEKGYSTGFGPGTNASDNFCKGEIRVKRSISIVLTNSYTAGLDAAYRTGLEQSLMDDQTSILKEIECTQTLNGSCIKIEYEADGGLEYLTTDRKQFIIIITNILVDYIEEV